MVDEPVKKTMDGRWRHKNHNEGPMTQDEIVERNVFKVRLFIDAWRAVDPDVVRERRSEPGALKAHNSTTAEPILDLG